MSINHSKNAAVEPQILVLNYELLKIFLSGQCSMRKVSTQLGEPDEPADAVRRSDIVVTAIAEGRPGGIEHSG
jgi:hypothetical protein